MATRLAMATEVLHMIGNDDSKLDLCKDWVDRAYAEVQHWRPFRETEASTTFPTVATQANYSLPADFHSVRTVRDSTSRKRRLTRIDQQQYDDQAPTEGPPTHYAIIENELWLVPTPDAIYTILFRYRKNLPTLADGDHHLLPAPWTDIIVLGAAARGLSYYNEDDRASKVRMMQSRTLRLITDPSSLDLFDNDQDGTVLPGVTHV
jgi:hypothetical protein